MPSSRRSSPRPRPRSPSTPRRTRTCSRPPCAAAPASPNCAPPWRNSSRSAARDSSVWLIRATNSKFASFAEPVGSLKRAATLMPRREQQIAQENSAMTISPHDIARVLSEALPHMQRYDEETVVVKYGGHAMGEEDMAKSFARDIVLMEQTAINPVVVHGGGPQIGEMLKRLGIKSEFAGGLRITDAATIEIVEMVLAGSINKQLVGFINEAGGKAIGLTGKDGNMVLARKVNRTVVDPGSNIERMVDLGFVGEPDKVDTTVLTQILGRDLIPVLAPLAAS